MNNFLGFKFDFLYYYRYQKLLNVVEDFPNLCHLEKKVHTLVSKKGRYCRNLLANAEKYFQSENFTQG